MRRRDAGSSDPSASTAPCPPARVRARRVLATCRSDYIIDPLGRQLWVCEYAVCARRHLREASAGGAADARAGIVEQRLPVAESRPSIGKNDPLRTFSAQARSSDYEDSQPQMMRLLKSTERGPSLQPPTSLASRSTTSLLMIHSRFGPFQINKPSSTAVPFGNSLDLGSVENRFDLASLNRDEFCDAAQVGELGISKLELVRSRAQRNCGFVGRRQTEKGSYNDECGAERHRHA